MIRVLQEADIDRVAEIWLDSNLKAHHFIPAQYWKSNFGLVKEMLSQAEVYVYENDRNIQGFTGLNGEYIEGIFVSDEMQSHGIGKMLLDYVKSKKEKLPKPQNQIDTVLSGEFGRLLVKYVNRNNRQKERGQSNE